MNTLAYPWALALLFPIAFGAWRMLRRSRRTAVAFSRLALVPAAPTLRQRLAIVSPVLFIAGLFCGVIALARPRTEFARSRETRNSIAIEMAIDISGSMMALDFSPDRFTPKTRLDVVKATFKSFVEKRPDDMIGLVSFGGYAATRCPLTLDHEALISVLDACQVPGFDGAPIDDEEVMTAIGEGLAMACARLASATNIQTHVTILLSDGVNNFGDITPEQATALARQQGVRVYVIGVGSNGYADMLGYYNGRKITQKTRVEIDEKALKRIADETGGKYYNVRNTTALEKALEDIDTLEKTAIETLSYKHYDEGFAPWVAWCAALCLLALVLGGVSRRALL